MNKIHTEYLRLLKEEEEFGNITQEIRDNCWIEANKKIRGEYANDTNTI